jgi:uncharacterized protein (DUF488 family)
MAQAAATPAAPGFSGINMTGYGNRSRTDVAFPDDMANNRILIWRAKRKSSSPLAMNRRRPRQCWTSSKVPGVKLLVDVRAIAASRRPGFSKNQLAAGLDERGISYLHLRALGTPKDGRDAARSGKFDTLHKIYAAHLKTPQAREELDELSSLVRKSGPVCILCYERDHQHCHRQWIAEIIEARDGVRIENLVAPQI